MDEKNHSVNNFISEKMTPGGLFSNYLVLSAVFSQQLRKQPLFSLSALRFVWHRGVKGKG